MTTEEFLTKRKPFYLDVESILIKFPDARHSNMTHAEWFADYGMPWLYAIRGYYWKDDTDEYVMLYQNDYQLPNISVEVVSYLFAHFLNIKWIGLGCYKGTPGEIWKPKFKVYRQ